MITTVGVVTILLALIRKSENIVTRHVFGIITRKLPERDVQIIKIVDYGIGRRRKKKCYNNTINMAFDMIFQKFS